MVFSKVQVAPRVYLFTDLKTLYSFLSHYSISLDNQWHCHQWESPKTQLRECCPNPIDVLGQKASKDFNSPMGCRPYRSIDKLGYGNRYRLEETVFDLFLHLDLYTTTVLELLRLENHGPLLSSCLSSWHHDHAPPTPLAFWMWMWKIWWQDVYCLFIVCVLIVY